MKAPGISIALTATLVIGQSQTISIRPHPSTAKTVGNRSEAEPSQPEEKRHVKVGVAVLGYFAGPGTAELHAIVGSSGSPLIGDQIGLPSGTQRLYLPPGQRYALLEEADQPISVWTLHRRETLGGEERGMPIAGAISRPDLVAFSPRGEAALLYSQASSSLQVVHHLPAQSSIARQLSIQGFGEVSNIAVADDAALVIAAFTDGRLMISSENGQWRSLAIGFTPVAWLFLPNKHDLVISDSTQNEIVLLAKVDETPTAVAIIAQEVQADRLGVAKDGEQLIAASTSQNKLWTVELKTGVVKPLARNSSDIDSLISLRDGRSFLLSSSSLSALNPAEFANRIVSLADKDAADQAQRLQGER